ncbi:hypothetical protein Tco_0839973 [Tanacetum coccineum]|uniref:Transposase (Putative), gypsy type n=1 Tax=Tanacetum coccineum TaxID=301880 RepID=A0ABQ5AS66_9ASTR
MAGVGPLSGNGPRVIVFADASVLPWSVFVRGDATGAALKTLTITSLKCVLTQEHLNAICAKYFVPKEVHPQLPSPDATMHERPTSKVGMYTRFFDYANYRILFSTFFVSILTYFRIPFSQLFVFGSAKVSHFEILCRVCNIEPDVSLFRYFYIHNYKNGWFRFIKRPNVSACYSKNLDSVKNWNDHFFWVDEFVVPVNARFSWFLGSNIVKDRAPALSEYNVEHVNTLIAQASPFLRFPKEFLCWVGISRNYLLNKDTYPRFEYENGEGGVLFSVRTLIIVYAFLVFLFPYPFSLLSFAKMDLNAFIRTANPRKVRVVERARAENERPIVTVAKHHTVTLLPTSVVRSSGELSASVEREFVGDASVGDGEDQGFDSVAGQDNVEPTVPVTKPVEAEIPRPTRSKKKRVTYDSEGLPVASHPPKRLRADYGDTRCPALPTLPFITSSVTALPLEEGEDRTDSVTGPSLRTIGCCSVMTKATIVEHRAEEAVGAGSEEIYVPEWTVTKGFEMNDGRLCANMIDHFTPPTFFKTVRGMEHEQLFTEFNKRKWRSLAEEKNILLEAKDKEIEDLKSQLLRAREESAEVTQLRAQVSGLEATENSLRGEVASAKDHNVLLEQECNSLKLKVTGLESAIVEKDHELSELGASSSSLKSQNQSLVDQVHELEISSADLREKLEMYEGSLKQLEEFQDNLMGPLRTRLAEIDADFTRCCMRFQESFHPHLLNYMEALGHAFGRAIEKGMQEGLAAGIEHGQAGRCLTDLEAYIPSAEDDFNSAIRELRDLNFPLLQELSNKKDASTWDIMDLLRLDDAVAKTLGMTDLHLRFGVALIELPAEVPATNVLYAVVIVPHTDPSVFVEDYDNPDSADVVPKNAS